MSKQPANLARQDYANHFQQTQTAPQYNIGDADARIRRVGTAKAWICTAAGSPGTWTSEDNL